MDWIKVHNDKVVSKWDELVAPKWTQEKMRPYQYIEDYLTSNNTWQGRIFSLNNR